MTTNGIEIEEGEHIYRVSDGFFRPWNDLSQEQQAALLKARDAVEDAFRMCER